MQVYLGMYAIEGFSTPSKVKSKKDKRLILEITDSEVSRVSTSEIMLPVLDKFCPVRYPPSLVLSVMFTGELRSQHVSTSRDPSTGWRCNPAAGAIAPPVPFCTGFS